MKKRLLISAILASSISASVSAGGFYVGPTFSVQNISASSSNFTGVSPKLTFGYSTVSDGIYLAGEVFAVPATINFANNVGVDGVSAKPTYGYGASFLPGAKISDKVMSYLRLGFVRTRFTGPSTNSFGAQIGCGIQTLLFPRWDLRAEYTYSWYESSYNLGATKSNELGLGVIYHLNL